MQRCSKLFLKLQTYSKSNLKGATTCLSIWPSSGVIPVWGEKCRANLLLLRILLQSHAYVGALLCDEPLFLCCVSLWLIQYCDRLWAERSRFAPWSSSQHPDGLQGPPCLLSKWAEGSIQWDKTAGCNGRKWWRYTSTHLYIFMALWWATWPTCSILLIV